MATLVRRDWLDAGPLGHLIDPYIVALRGQRYGERTIRGYVGCLAHFCHWMACDAIAWSAPEAVSLVERFLRDHLPTCVCPVPCYASVASSGAALRHLLKLLPASQPDVLTDPVTVELERFGEYLSNTCGLAPVTCDRRLHIVGCFLVRAFGSRAATVSQIASVQLDEFFAELSTHLQPASLRTACNSLRSYFRYRALLGDSTAGLAAALPRVADWQRTTLPKVLSDAELEAFLATFDLTDPVGLRDYAIARCLLDLGLRGQEVTYLTLESLDWRQATLTISGTKSKRVQQLPLPAVTGEAIARYLREGRPTQSQNRALFVRHRAPFDKLLLITPKD
jgi:site-specific recombinase XerD